MTYMGIDCTYKNGAVDAMSMGQLMLHHEWGTCDTLK